MEAMCTGHALTRLLQQWDLPQAPPSPVHPDLTAANGAHRDGNMAGSMSPAPRRLRLSVIWQPDRHMRHAQYRHIFQTLYLPHEQEGEGGVDRSMWAKMRSLGSWLWAQCWGGREVEDGYYSGLEPVAVYHQQPEWLKSDAYNVQVRTAVRFLKQRPVS